jgi:hypothetical protein
MRRLILAGTAAIALAVPVSITAALVATPAGAAAGVSCKKLTGSIASTFTISACKPANKKNKSATGTSSSLATGSGTLTWSKSGQTTTVSLSVTSKGQGGCSAGSTEYDVSGTVTGGTSTYTKTGDAVSGRACASATGSLSLVNKTALHI